MIKILFICLGNICRSPMAQYIMQDKINKQNLNNKIYVNSCATNTEELGNDIYYPAKQILQEKNIPFNKHSAKQLKPIDYSNYDYLIGMDTSNISNIKKIVGKDKENKIYRLLDFTNNPKDIADPWYYGNFDKTFNEISFGCDCLLDFLIKDNKDIKDDKIKNKKI